MSEIYSTDGLGNYAFAIAPVSSYQPAAYFYNNKTYFVWYSKDFCSYVAYYDHITKTFSPYYLVSEGDEIHHIPVLIVSNDGYIIIAVEVGPSHPSFVTIFRSNFAEDISSGFTGVKTIGGGYSYISYPHLKIIDDNMYMIVRDTNHYVSILISSDNGATWSDAVRILKVYSGTLAYINMTITNDFIGLYVNEWNQTTTLLRRCYFLKSLDGDTFTSFDGLTEHTVSEDGIIEDDELAPFLFLDSGSDTRSNMISSSMVSSSGKIFVITREYNLTYPYDKDQYVMYYAAGMNRLLINAFSNQDDLWTNMIHSIIAENDALLKVICMETINGKVELTIYTSTDYGLSWVRTRNLTSNSDFNHYYPQITHNIDYLNPNNIIMVFAGYQNNGLISSDIRILTQLAPEESLLVGGCD